VVKDVIDGYVTAKSAHDDYGIVLSADGRRLDVGATAALREKMLATNARA
jgi:hypothetical protein